MEELLACRVCLITNVKLFDMFKNNLAESFEMLTGARASLRGLPRHICSICAALLLKSALFKKKCDRAQNILTRALKQHRRLTTARLRSIDRSLHSLDYSLKTETVKENYFINEVEVAYPMKEEYLDDSDFEDRDVDTTFEAPFKYESSESAANKEEALEDSKESENSTDDFEEEQQIGEVLYESDEEPLPKIKEKALKDSREESKNNTDNAVVVLSRDQQIEGMLLNNVTNLNLNKEPITPESDEELMSEEQLRNSNVEVMVVVFSKEQQIERVLSRKSSSNYLNSPYKCDKCYKGFLTNSSFQNHMVKHDPARGPHECYACGTRWASKVSLQHHIQTTHERQYTCLKCDHVARTSNKANEHGKWHRGIKYTCNICGATFDKPTSHLSHLRLKHPSSHRCDECGDSFLGPRGVAQHKLLVHTRQSGEGSSVDLPAEERDIALCGQCGVQFRSADALERHARAAGDDSCDSLRPCVRCGAGFPSDAALTEHARTHAKDQPTVKCQECSRTFPGGRGYVSHYRRVHRGVHARCSAACTHVCEVCGSAWRSASQLSLHQRTHTGEKPYGCSVCAKRFRVKDTLKAHMRAHSGERPYKCAKCPKAFKAKAVLIRHDLVHTGEKPYSCSYCGRAFSQAKSMKLHVRALHRRPPPPAASREH